MDGPTLILKKTNPGELKQNKEAFETLLKDDKTLKTFKKKPMAQIPFVLFTDVKESLRDDKEEKPFLLCPFNQSEKGYRSPWTNQLYKVKTKKSGAMEVKCFHTKEITRDEQKIHEIENSANEVWEAYRELYYGEDSIGCAFVKKPREKGSFEALFGVNKTTGEDSWDCVHIVWVGDLKNSKKKCDYRVESAVVVSIGPHEKTKIDCSLTKETVKECEVRPSNILGSHLENLGCIMETVEMEFRSKLEQVHIPKGIDVMESTYREAGASATVHLIQQMGGDVQKPSTSKVMKPTGMAVGKAMIGEIALKAQKGDAEKVISTVEKNKKDKEASKKTNETGDEYGDMKKTLKKSTPKQAVVPQAVIPKMELKNVKDGLKRTPKTTRKTVNAMKDGDDAANALRASLKKTMLSPGGEAKPKVEPTPEFANFRNKLKKSNK